MLIASSLHADCKLRIAVPVVQVLCVLTAWKRHMILWENDADGLPHCMQVLCVLTAWKRHMILWENATKFKQVTNYLIAADCVT